MRVLGTLSDGRGEYCSMLVHGKWKQENNMMETCVHFVCFNDSQKSRNCSGNALQTEISRGRTPPQKNFYNLLTHDLMMTGGH